jgi:ATP-binding cassette subfamily B protein
MQEERKKNIDFYIFKRLLKDVKPYKSLFASAFISTIVLSLVSAYRPKLMGEMVGDYIEKTQNAEQLFFWTLILIGILCAETLLQFLSSYLSNLLGQSIIRDMRKKLFKHILSFRIRFFDNTPIGSLVTRMVSDIEAISDVFSQGLISILGDLLMLVAILIFMFLANWKLAALTIIPVPMLIFATRIFAQSMKKAFNKERIQVNKLNNFVQERLTGMTIVQLFNRQHVEMEQFREINKGHRQAHIDAVWAFSIFFPVVELLMSISVAMLLVWGVLQIEWVHGANNVFSEITMFTLWIQMLYKPIRQLADKFNVLQRGIVRAERVYELLERKEQVQDLGKNNGVDFSLPIHFNNIWFAYKNEDWVLKDIHLTIQPNETIAFVGATGAGKSTIINLLSRFYDVQKGAIRIGDVPINSIDLSYLRKNIAVVLQDVFLFSESLLYNITLGDESISKNDVVAAAKEVGAHEFIMKLPGDYNYNVGERGGVLSVGQRQLISFVRAAVYKPHILVLDEATSSVDNESEQLIQEATERLTQNRTSIVIAHRLSTIQKADKIVVMENGEIIEMGNHQSLLAQNGHYKKLVDLQYNHA